MAILNLGGVDYSGNIVVGSYNVNSTDVYSSWTDANCVEHRHIQRQRVTGSFDMEFRTMAQYEAFVDHLKEQRNQQGWIPCYLFVNNLKIAKSCKMFVQFKSFLDRKNNYTVNYIPKFTVEVSEA